METTVPVNGAYPRLAIALCTRQRPDELLRACRSISASCTEGGTRALAALVVDAGPLPDAERAQVLSALAPAAGVVEHLDVAGRVDSLYQSRIVALRRARELGATHVAFFDDDVELMPDYVRRLSEILEHSRPAMVGGIDIDLHLPGPVGRLWCRLIGVSSGDPATISSSGFTRSMFLWAQQTEPFRSEFASGCNMTLDVRILERLSPEAERRFVTYSLGEDLYLSTCASRMGEVLIDPGLRVRHHLTPRAREGRQESGRQLVVNTAWLARETSRGRLAYAWSIFWLAARALVEDLRLGQPRGQALGMLQGAGEASRLLVRR